MHKKLLIHKLKAGNTMNPQQFFTWIKNETPTKPDAPIGQVESGECLKPAVKPLVHRFSDYPMAEETKALLDADRRKRLIAARETGRYAHTCDIIAHTDKHCERMSWMML
jgi:hypothetical protein